MAPATDEQYQRAAEAFVDALLDPRKPWLVRWVLYRKTFDKFLPIPSQQQIQDGSLAAAIYQGWDADYIADEWFHDALIGKDRNALVSWFIEEARVRELTSDELSRLLACTD